MPRPVLTGARSARIRKAAEQAPDTGLKPDESEQAAMLKRIESEQNPARTLSMNEDQIILVSTR